MPLGFTVLETSMPASPLRYDRIIVLLPLVLAATLFNTERVESRSTAKPIRIDLQIRVFRHQRVLGHVSLTIIGH